MYSFQDLFALYFISYSIGSSKFVCLPPINMGVLWGVDTRILKIRCCMSWEIEETKFWNYTFFMGHPLVVLEAILNVKTPQFLIVLWNWLMKNITYNLNCMPILHEPGWLQHDNGNTTRLIHDSYKFHTFSIEEVCTTKTFVQRHVLNADTWNQFDHL